MVFKLNMRNEFVFAACF